MPLPALLALPLSDALLLVGIGLGVLLAGFAIMRKRRALAALLVMAALILGLFGNWYLPIAKEAAENLYLIDLSRSNLARYDAASWQKLDAHLAALHRADARPARVVFVDRAVQRVETFAPNDALSLGALPDPRASEALGFNFSAALALAASPSHRTIIVSDGAWRGALPYAGLPPERVLIVEPPQDLADAARIVKLSAPSRLAEGEAALIEVAISAGKSAAAVLHWQFGEGPHAVSGIFDMTLSQLATTQRWSISAAQVAAQGSAEVRLRLLVEAKGLDRIFENNQLEHTFQIGGPSRLLLISSAENAADSPAAKLLRAGGYLVKVIKVAAMPRHAEDYLGYGSIILDDVALDKMPAGGAALRTAVTHFGANLVVAGSRSAWGPGGYQGTRFEQMLPLDANPKPEHKRWHLLLLDASDSMNEVHRGQARFAWLREAVAAYLSALDEEDQLLVVPFNRGLVGAAGGIVRRFEGATIEERESILRELSTITPSSQTHVQSSLAAAIKLLSESREKHEEPALITLFSDAIEGGEAHPELLELLDGQGATLRTMLLNDQQPEWLSDLAAESKRATLGRVEIEEVRDLASLAERIRRERDTNQGKLFHPEAIEAFELGINGEPFLVAPWVETSAKPGAANRELARLSSAERFPLAASWRYINGRVVGIAASLCAPDSTLANQAGWQKFFAGMIRELEGDAEAALIEVRWREGHLAASLRHPDITSRAPALFASILGAEGESSPEVELHRTGPFGEFESLRDVGGQEQSRGARVRLRVVEDGQERVLILPLPQAIHPEFLPSFHAFSECSLAAAEAGIATLASGSTALPELAPAMDVGTGLALSWVLAPLLLLAGACFIFARRREEQGIALGKTLGYAD